MVGSGYVVKLGDFGMARAMYDSDYYRFGRKGKFRLFYTPRLLYPLVYSVITARPSFYCSDSTYMLIASLPSVDKQPQPTPTTCLYIDDVC